MNFDVTKVSEKTEISAVEAVDSYCSHSATKKAVQF